MTIPALNDSRYIGLSVYIVFICGTLGSLVIFIPSEQIQFSYFLQSFFIVICTTAAVCLVFVPKVKFFFRREEGKKTKSFYLVCSLLKYIVIHIRERNNRE